MKKSSRRCSIAILMMICLCIVLSIPSIPVQAADNLSENEMIYGADIGFLSQLESQGVEWVDDNGNTRDALELLKEKGVNAVRLRVFVNHLRISIGLNLMVQIVCLVTRILRDFYIQQKEQKS